MLHNGGRYFLMFVVFEVVVDCITVVVLLLYWLLLKVLEVVAEPSNASIKPTSATGSGH